jgi:RNA polymerase sigma-70 factor, ECF subfamily
MRSDYVDLENMTASNPGRADGHDEAVLIKQAANGDSEAFGVLYARYLDAIYRYIYFRIGDEIEAEDITEEVFIRAWEALPNYSYGEYPFTSWLYRIARNRIIDHHRKRKTQVLPDDELHPGGIMQSSEEKLVQKLDSADLAKAIQMLEEEEQQVVILRFVEGLSHREVAAVIGKSEGASRIIQHRALAALQKALKQWTRL